MHKLNKPTYTPDEWDYFLINEEDVLAFKVGCAFLGFVSAVVIAFVFYLIKRGGIL